MGGLHRLRQEGDDHTIQPEALARLRRECRVVPAAMRAGFASVHSDLCAHLSMGPNHSPRRRLGITISYCPTDAGVQDCAGSRWSARSFIPPGSTVAAPWSAEGKLERPAMDGPSGFAPARL